MPHVRMQIASYDNQPYVEGRSTNINTDAEYYNRMNYGQPEQPNSGSVNPNMGADILRINYTQTIIPQPNPQPSQNEILAHKSNRTII